MGCRYTEYSGNTKFSIREQEGSAMLTLYLQMLDTPEEKVRFEEVYLTYRGLMYHTANRILHNRQDAEDAVHNAFLQVIKHF